MVEKSRTGSGQKRATKSKAGNLLEKALRKHLFREAAEEDIAGTTNADIDVLVERAREFLDVKAPGRVKIRISDTGVSDGTLAQRCILEILNDDMPFLVDSIINALSRRGHTVQTVLHPVFASERDSKGKLKTLDNSKKQTGDFLRESYLHIHLEALNSKREQDELVGELKDILDEIRAAVVDWQPMQHVIQGRIENLRTKASPLPTAIVSETIDFLSWLLNNKFTFLGMCHYKLGKKGGKKQMLVDEKSALGVLRLQRGQVIQNAAKRDLANYKSGYAIVVEKSDLVSRVHRSAVMDYVGLYDFDQAGNVIGELRVVGLFASTAYTEAASGIPLLRRRIEAVMALSGFTPSGHSGKGLLNILETMSRDDLFQIELNNWHRLQWACGGCTSGRARAYSCGWTGLRDMQLRLCSFRATGSRPISGRRPVLSWKNTTRARHWSSCPTSAKERWFGCGLSFRWVCRRRTCLIRSWFEKNRAGDTQLG